MHSLKDELEIFFSGRGMPYEKVSLTVAIVVALVFSMVFSNNYIKDASVSVIDLDNSKYSHELIQQLDASPYIGIQHVVNVPVEPKSLFYRDKSVAVIYLPNDLEKNRYTYSSGSIGVFYDQSNAAQTGNLKAALNEFVALENQKNIEEFAAINGVMMQDSSMLLQDRELFNPTDSAANGENLGFLMFFSLMFFVFATIGLVPRLRLERKWEHEVEEETPFSLMLRIVPYGCCFITAIIVGLAILRIVGDLTIAGNFLIFLFALVLLVISTGMMSLLFGWNAANPGVAASRMILFIPGGFILGGMTGPIPILPDWAQLLSNFFPLVWGYRFARDILLRGASFMDCAQDFGGFMIYTGIIAVFFCIRFYRERNLNELVVEE